MASASDKGPHILLSLYDKLYQEKYGHRPKYNRYREKWAMQDVIDSIGLDRAKDVIAYYFKVSRAGHPLQWFFYNFDKLDDMMSQSIADAERRAWLREQTKKMVEESEHRSSSN